LSVPEPVNSAILGPKIDRIRRMAAKAARDIQPCI
jgi:hypothetical protein